MPRLIDADALERDIRKDAYCLYEADDAIAFVRDAPTIDAEPVRHGCWKTKGATIVCSCCGNGFTRWDDDGNQNEPQFLCCPNCGAKMDEEKEGES